MAGAALMVVLIPVFGLLSDRVGRRAMAVGALLVYLAALYPLYAWLAAEPTTHKLLVLQLAVSTIVAAFYGVFSVILAELFPPQVRSLGMSTAYNISVMVFGGFAPFIVTWLFGTTGSAMAPAFYVMFGASLGLVAAFFIQEQTPNEDAGVEQAIA